jgi:hypothetical protein
MSDSKWASAIRLPSAKFPNIGDKVEGTVLEVVDAPVPHFDDKNRIDGNEKDAEGNDVMQLDVVLQQTGGSKIVLHTGGAIFYAIGRALAEVGSEDVAPGDTLTVEYTGDGEPTAKGRNAPKQYAAVIVKK